MVEGKTITQRLPVIVQALLLSGNTFCDLELGLDMATSGDCLCAVVAESAALAACSCAAPDGLGAASGELYDLGV